MNSVQLLFLIINRIVIYVKEALKNLKNSEEKSEEEPAQEEVVSLSVRGQTAGRRQTD